MRKSIIVVVAAVCLLTACSSTESGAVNGASLGSVFGGSVGGLLGGYRGHNIGTMVGLVAGGASGAAIGSQTEAKRREATYEDRRQSSEQRAKRRVSDVRKQTDAGSSNRYSYDAGNETQKSPLTLRNLRFVGQDGNDAINRGEICNIVFELANASGHAVSNVVPYVSELQGNEHITISPSTSVESIANGDALRYTATLRADSRLKAGTATFRIAVSTDGSEFIRLRDFSVPTAK